MSANATTPCQSDECMNGNPPSKLECPTCSKLGIKGSVFCTQECFKKGWKSHKRVHDLLQPNLIVYKDGTHNPFPNFPWTGTM